MKSNSELKDFLISGNILDEFFFTHFNIDFDGIGGFGFPLKASSGVNAQRMGLDYQEKYKKKSLIHLLRDNQSISVSTYDDDTFRIQIFLDQYGYLGRQLPVFSEEVIASNMIWQNKYKTYDEVRQAMQIMLKPLNTYDDFIERIKEIEVFRQWQIIRPEMLPLGNINSWSWGDIYGECGGFILNQSDTNEWQLISGSRGRTSHFATFFREQAVYEWFVNLYLGLL